MYTTTTTVERQTIVSMLAEGKPTWYVAAVTKSHRHDVHQIGTELRLPGSRQAAPGRQRLGRPGPSRLGVT